MGAKLTNVCLSRQASDKRTLRYFGVGLRAQIGSHLRSPNQSDLRVDWLETCERRTLVMQICQRLRLSIATSSRQPHVAPFQLRHVHTYRLRPANPPALRHVGVDWIGPGSNAGLSCRIFRPALECLSTISLQAVTNYHICEILKKCLGSTMVRKASVSTPAI